MNEEENKQGRNSCYTYFAIKGNFEPDEISKILNLSPAKQWKIGDLRRNGKSRYDFALWEYGRCNDYDVYVENQMMKTISSLMSKTNELKAIKKQFDVNFVLEVVPSVYVDESTPCLAPNREVIKFCYETETDIDIDLYVFDSTKI